MAGADTTLFDTRLCVSGVQQPMSETDGGVMCVPQASIFWFQHKVALGQWFSIALVFTGYLASCLFKAWLDCAQY